MNNIQFHLGKKKLHVRIVREILKKNKGSGGEVCTNCLFKKKMRIDLYLALYIPFFLQICALATSLILWLFFISERCCTRHMLHKCPGQTAQHQPVFLTPAALYSHVRWRWLPA